MSNLTYHEQIDKENILRLRELIRGLPPFCADFFRGIEPRTSSRTRIAYAYDLHVFFDFLHKENPALASLDIKDITLDHLEQLSVTDLEEYMEYLNPAVQPHRSGRRHQRAKKGRNGALEDYPC